ncbi:MAG: hypothetical protein JXA49_03060 [Actinobacteria bacterium]|nr:hypothetical protein [Actinomycetota bacterium]
MDTAGKEKSSFDFEQRIAVLFLILGGYFLGAQLLGWSVGFATYRTFIYLTGNTGVSSGARVMMWFASRTEMHLLITGIVVVLIAVHLGKDTWIEKLKTPFLIFTTAIFFMLTASTIILAVNVDLFPTRSGLDWITFRTLMFLVLDIVFLGITIFVQTPCLQNMLSRLLGRRRT